MALAVEAPARDDLSFRTNDDRLVGARWLKSDAATPVVITAATFTLAFDLAPPTYDPDGAVIPPVPERHVIDSTTTGDPNGWIDSASLANGIVLVTVPHDIWANYEMSTGIWDVIAVGEGVQRCLVRGEFCAEQGVST